MKYSRQEMILKIIEEKAISTQVELVEALNEKGFQVNQSTVSRDIKQLHLVKVPDHWAGIRYAVQAQEKRQADDRLTRIFKEAILSIDYASNQVVIKTLTGSASTAAELIDRMDWTEVLGTIAGDNTILLIARTELDAKEVAESLRAFLR